MRDANKSVVKNPNPGQEVRDALNLLVREQVISAIGEPDELHSVDVRWLWKDRYRVNVLLVKDLLSGRIVSSYFVEVDSAGCVVKSTPPFKKLHRAALLERTAD